MSKRPSIRSRRQRRLCAEQLENRRLLVAEGALYVIDETIDAASVAGAVRSIVRWGDGTETVQSVANSGDDSKLFFTFDYTLDANGFFSGDNSHRRELLELAGEVLLSRLTDTLSAITPGGVNQWSPSIRHPSSGDPLNPPVHNLPGSLRVRENEIIVYVGSRDFPGNIRGLGGPGAAGSRGTAAFNRTVATRGEPGVLATQPTDFAPSIGSVSFDVDTSTNWYFGKDPNGMQGNEVDFVSVAVHELTHVLGFGIAESWTNQVDANNKFTGANARAAYDGTGGVPVHDAHWEQGVLSSDGLQPSMTGLLDIIEERVLLTALDYGALDDMGWQVADSSVTVSASHRFPDNEGGDPEGQFAVSVVLQGSQGGELISELVVPIDLVTVTNVRPSLDVVGNQVVVAGQPLEIPDIGTITDPGFRNPRVDPTTRETFTYSIDWGDGTIDVGSATIDNRGNASGELTRASFDGRHTYQTPGNQTVRVRVEDDDGGARTKTIDVTVTAPPQLQLTLDRAAVDEDDGPQAAKLTIVRTGPVESAQLVLLNSSDGTEATVPATATIPAGQPAVDVFVQAVDDVLLDGTVPIDLTASAQGFDSDTIELLVRDHESLAAAATANRISENDQEGIQVTVSRSNTDADLPLTIDVEGGDHQQLEGPATITIPPNEQQQTVRFTPVDDFLPELTSELNFTFTAAGYVADSIVIEILDDEPPAFQNPADRFDVNGQDGVQASDALRIINELFRRRVDDGGGTILLDPQSEQPGGIFLDVNGDYQLSALDALNVINELYRRQVDGNAIIDNPIHVVGVDEEPSSVIRDAFLGAPPLF